MKRFLFWNSLLILAIGGLFWCGQIVFAQGISVGITPLVFELTGTPGEVIENQVKVFNSSDSFVGIKITTEDIAPANESGQVKGEPAGTETYSLANWIKFDPERFTLNPKEEKWIKFTITVPENAEPGGHYGSVIAGSEAVIGPQTTGAALVLRVGSLILLTVPGNIKESLIVKGFTAPGYSEYGPINFAIRFENQGTVHAKPKGIITITSWLGKKVADIPIPEKNVLPTAIRKIDASWSQKWLWAGKYTATLTGNYGISNLPLTPTVITFWAFPWKFGLIFLAVLILFILTRRRWLMALKILIKGTKAAK